jgi:hypothetical protein
MQKILENERVKCVYDADFSLFIVEWNDKAITFEQYQEPYLFLLEYNEKIGKTIQSIIVDIRNQKVIPPHFRKWFEEVAVKKAMAQGLQRAIAVSNANVFKKYYLNNILNSTKRFGLPLKIYNSVEEAKEWLKSIKK